MSPRVSRPLPVAVPPPPVLPARPEGVPHERVLGVDVWAGERFTTPGGREYAYAWARVATALWTVGVDPAYAWGAADVGFLVTGENRDLFDEGETARYRAAVRTQQITEGAGQVAAVVEGVRAVLRRTLVEVLADPGPGAARRGVDRVFDQAVREGVDLEDYRTIAAFVFDALYTWLAAVGARGADPDTCLGWVDAHLGEEAGRDAAVVTEGLAGPVPAARREQIGRPLGDRHVPALVHLVAAAVATAGGGDVGFLDGADPAYYSTGETDDSGDAEDR